MRSKFLLAACAGAGAAFAVAAVAAAGNGGVAPVRPESPNADAITTSWWFVMGFTGAIFLLVEGALLAFVLRFRRRGRPRDAEGPQIRGNVNLEIAWTVVPVLILAAIGSFVLFKLPAIRDVPSAGAAGARLDVTVTGYRFYWQFEYGNGVVSVDRLRVPVGRPVRLTVTAPAWDVIHSWWIPALGGKIDAIPGRVNETWFEARRAGVFKGQCAEFCGAQHAAMLASVEAMRPAAFERWLTETAAAQAAGTSDLGRETFAGVCAKCHGRAGEGLIGPPLKGSAIAADPASVARVIRAGRRTMPPVGRDWSRRQLAAVTSYLKERFSDGGQG